MRGGGEGVIASPPPKNLRGRLGGLRGGRGVHAFWDCCEVGLRENVGSCLDSFFAQWYWNTTAFLETLQTTMIVAALCGEEELAAVASSSSCLTRCGHSMRLISPSSEVQQLEP